MLKQICSPKYISWRTSAAFVPQHKRTHFRFIGAPPHLPHLFSAFPLTKISYKILWGWAFCHHQKNNQLDPTSHNRGRYMGAPNPIWVPERPHELKQRCGRLHSPKSRCFSFIHKKLSPRPQIGQLCSSRRLSYFQAHRNHAHFSSTAVHYLG